MPRASAASARAALVGVAALAAVALVGGCASSPTEGDATAGGTTSTAAAAPSGSASTPPPSAPPPVTDPAQRPVAVAVSVRGGKVSPPPRAIPVKVGRQVVIAVTVDKADELHVHEPYDLERPLPAGRTTTLAFVADAPGRVDVELHESGKVLFQLLVS